MYDINLLNKNLNNIIMSANYIINNDRERCIEGAIGRIYDIFAIANERFNDITIKEYSVNEQNLIKWQALENFLFSTYHQMNRLKDITPIYSEIINTSIQSFITDEKYFNQAIIKKDLAIKGNATIVFSAEISNVLLNSIMILICKILCGISIFEPNKEIEDIIQNYLVQNYLDKNNYCKLIKGSL